MSEIITCSNCEAKYEVTYTSIMFRDRDSEDCDCCGKRLASWNGSSIPHFRLVSRPENSKSPPQ